MGRPFEMVRLIEVPKADVGLPDFGENLYAIFAEGVIDPKVFVQAINVEDVSRIGLGMMLDADNGMPPIEAFRRAMVMAVEHRWLAPSRPGFERFAPEALPGARQVTVIDANFLKIVLYPEMKWVEFASA